MFNTMLLHDANFEEQNDNKQNSGPVVSEKESRVTFGISLRLKFGILIIMSIK